MGLRKTSNNVVTNLCLYVGNKMCNCLVNQVSILQCTVDMTVWKYTNGQDGIQS